MGSRNSPTVRKYKRCSFSNWKTLLVYFWLCVGQALWIGNELTHLFVLSSLIQEEFCFAFIVLGPPSNKYHCWCEVQLTFERIDWCKTIEGSYPVSDHKKFPLWKFVPYLKIVLVVWSWTRVFFKSIRLLLLKPYETRWHILRNRLQKRGRLLWLPQL